MPIIRSDRSRGAKGGDGGRGRRDQGRRDGETKGRRALQRAVDVRERAVGGAATVGRSDSAIPRGGDLVSRRACPALRPCAGEAASTPSIIQPTRNAPTPYALVRVLHAIDDREQPASRPCGRRDVLMPPRIGGVEPLRAAPSRRVTRRIARRRSRDAVREGSPRPVGSRGAPEPVRRPALRSACAGSVVPQVRNAGASRFAEVRVAAFR